VGKRAAETDGPPRGSRLRYFERRRARSAGRVLLAAASTGAGETRAEHNKHSRQNQTSGMQHRGERGREAVQQVGPG
jgi:hypothetical protein